VETQKVESENHKAQVGERGLTFHFALFTFHFFTGPRHAVTPLPLNVAYGLSQTAGKPARYAA